jgi:hypothetical protein
LGRDGQIASSQGLLAMMMWTAPLRGIKVPNASAGASL